MNQMNDCRDCFWFGEDTGVCGDFWCGYYNEPFNSLEACDKFAEVVEFTASHDITIGQGGKVTVKPNAGEEAYFSGRKD